MLYHFQQIKVSSDTATTPKGTTAATVLHVDDWEVHAGQHWGIVGGKEEQRTALLALLNDAKPQPIDSAEVSPLKQQQFIDAELLKAKTGIADEIVHGTSVQQILEQNTRAHDDKNAIAALRKSIAALNFEYCLPRYFRQLSSGETRRLLLILAVHQNPELLLLEDPFEGLDSDTRPIASQLLNGFLTGPEQRSEQQSEQRQFEPPQTKQKEKSRSSFFIASRADQLLPCTTHIAYIDGQQLKTLALDANRHDALANAISQLEHIINPNRVINIPPLPEDHPFHKFKTLAVDQPLVALVNGSVHYADQENPIFSGLNWRVMPGQHWRITGKNGSGKTTLLKMVNGDHPQVYRNNIEVCGYKRGSGESVWDVRRHIGYMGGDMLWNYRSSGQLAGTALAVVISGLYDSIGLYQNPNPADRHAAQAWLQLFDLQHLEKERFASISLAEQRLVLIARAMIKRPDLLILDEPLQALDMADRSKVVAIIEKLVEAKATTVLYVSHHDEEQVKGISHVLTM